MEDMEDQELFVPPTVFGVVYWKDHVVGAVNDHEQAEAAVADLVAAGFPAERTKAYAGDFVTEKHERFLANRSAFERFANLLPSNESEVMDTYVDAAAQGHSIMTVPAASDDEVQRAAEVLRRYGAHHLVHYRDLTFVKL